MNKNNSTIQQIFAINGKLETISAQLNSAKNALNVSDGNKYEVQLSKAICSTEKVVLQMRSIANYSFKLNNNPLACNRLMDQVSKEIYEIAIKKIGNTYAISLPCTLFHYDNYYNSKSLLTEPLNYSLRKYNKETEKISKMDKAVITVVNHVSGKTDSTSIRDNDNYDYKQIINSVGFWFLPDDNYKCCNMFTTTKMDSKNYTMVYITPAEEFVDFYKNNIQDIM